MELAAVLLGIMKGLEKIPKVVKTDFLGGFWLLLLWMEMERCLSRPSWSPALSLPAVRVGQDREEAPLGRMGDAEL